jgi:hypothetical protein
MFDDLTFALRYGPQVQFALLTLQYTIPVPITRDTVDMFKRNGCWQFLEDRFGPYVTEE